MGNLVFHWCMHGPIVSRRDGPVSIAIPVRKSDGGRHGSRREKRWRKRVSR